VLRYHLARPWLGGLRAWRRIGAAPPPALRILLLHDVPEARFDALDRLLDMVKRRHRFVAPDEAEAWLAGAAPQQGRAPCLLTFDDGFASNHAAATTVLARHGVKALFFVCPGLVELEGQAQRQAIATNIFDGRPGVADLSLMTWQEIGALKEIGHAIGAHSMTHRRLSLLRGEELAHEVRGCNEVLAARLGKRAIWFAFPFGSIDSVSAAALAVIASEFRFCRSGVRGPNTGATDRMAVRADHIDLEAPDAYLSLVVEGGLDWRYATQRRRLDALR
jgi:peptidoglycan/xylan/chitin deacetylase (PgdA/CDA1 family)